MNGKKEVKKSDNKLSVINDCAKRMSVMSGATSVLNRKSLKNMDLEALTIQHEPKLDFFFTEEMIYYMADLLLLRG